MSEQTQTEKQTPTEEQAQTKTTVSEQPPKFYKNPATATILSFFFMGLGQIYNGQIGKGILFLVLYFISIGLTFVIIGFVTTPILWIWGMVDANKSAKKVNEEIAAA